jgi:pSer/pThr/pTyr-binding forkhead associated (FHA) protein
MADFGILIALGGGEDIPLLQKKILIGRRENCDLVLRFPNVSGQHARLTLEEGYWFVKDLNSRYGTKVNGLRVDRKRLDNGDTLTLAKHQFRIDYDPEALGAYGPPPGDDDALDAILRTSLLSRAGMEHRDDKPDPNGS